MMITDEILLNLIDGTIAEKEAADIKRKISDDEDLARRYNRLLEVDRTLCDQPLYQPSPGFNKMIMEGLSKRFETRAGEWFWKRSLFIAIGLILIGFIAALVLLSNYTFINLIPTNVQEITIQKNTFTFDPGKIVDQDLFFKGLIYLNGFLGLLLLERAVFRPLFRHRRQRFSY